MNESEPSREQPAAPEPNPDKPAGYGDDDSPASDPTGGGQQIAEKFLQRAYFLALHERAGEAELHPIRGKVCFAIDFGLRLLAALILLAIAVVVAWKSLSPLPWED